MPLTIPRAPTVNRVDPNVGRVYDIPEVSDTINRFFSQNIEAPLVQDFQSRVLPGISRQYGGNQFFSSERARADHLAQRELIDSLTRGRSSLLRQGALDEQQARSALAGHRTQRAGVRAQQYGTRVQGLTAAEQIASQERVAQGQQRLQDIISQRQTALGRERLGLDQLLGLRSADTADRSLDIQRFIAQLQDDTQRYGIDADRYATDAQRYATDTQADLTRGQQGLDQYIADLQATLAREGISFDREALTATVQGQDADRELNQYVADLQAALEREGIAFDRESLAEQTQLAQQQLELDRFLGEVQADLQQQGLDLNVEALAADIAESTRALDIQEQGLLSDTELRQQQLDIQEALGFEGIETDRFIADLQHQIQRQSLALQEELGQGELDIANREVDIADALLPFQQSQIGAQTYNELQQRRIQEISLLLSVLSLPQFENVAFQGSEGGGPDLAGIAAIASLFVGA